MSDMILRIKSDYSLCFVCIWRAAVVAEEPRHSALYGNEWGDKEALKIIPSIMRGWYNAVSIVTTL
jgi:hypothetical protein